MIKEAIKERADEKRMLVVTVARTLHTYSNTLRILCEAFSVEYNGSHFKCERRLIQEAFSLNRQGKMLAIVIDDAHLLEIQTLRKLRLLFEDFPKNHNLILIGQPELMDRIALSVNQDIRSRVTYSVVMKRLNPDDMRTFLTAQLDRAGLGHNTFTEEVVELIVRSAEGILRMARNLALSCLLEGVRAQTRTVGIDLVNRVLLQPHWRNDPVFEKY